jgi:hypothetical protein
MMGNQENTTGGKEGSRGRRIWTATWWMIESSKRETMVKIAW